MCLTDHLWLLSWFYISFLVCLPEKQNNIKKPLGSLKSVRCTPTIMKTSSSVMRETEPQQTTAHCCFDQCTREISLCTLCSMHTFLCNPLSTERNQRLALSVQLCRYLKKTKVHFCLNLTQQHEVTCTQLVLTCNPINHHIQSPYMKTGQCRAAS